MNAQLRFARSIIVRSNSAAALSASHFYAAGQHLEGPPAPVVPFHDDADRVIATAAEAGEISEAMRRSILFESEVALRIQANLSRGLVLEFVA